MKSFKIVLLLTLLAEGGYCELETVLKVYTVRNGDTFYKISQKFYNTPDRWKEIWNYNKYIKKPHWIFPGDTLIVPTYREKAAKKEETSASPKQSAEAVKIEKKKEKGNPDLFIAPYYPDEEEPLDFDYAGKIVSFTEKQVIHAQYAKVVIDIGSADGVKKGDIFYIYRASKKIIHPETKAIVGVLLKKMG